MTCDWDQYFACFPIEIEDHNTVFQNAAPSSARMANPALEADHIVMHAWLGTVPPSRRPPLSQPEARCTRGVNRYF